MGLFDIFNKKNNVENISTNEQVTNNKSPKNWSEVTEFNFNKPYEGNPIPKIGNIVLPQDYLDFMLIHNGGEGDLGATWFVLYPLEELEEINKDYNIYEFLPESIIIGTNGDSEFYGINSNGEYFNVPSLMEEKYVTLLGKDFNQLPDRINKLWSKK